MKEESKRIRLIMENVLTEAIDTLKKDYPSESITDLYVRINQPKKTLSIYDDENRKLKNLYLEEVIKEVDKLDFFYSNAPRLLKEAAINCRNKKLLDGLNILAPMSFIVIDDDEQTLLEYVLIDNDKIMVEEELLKDLDKDLDAFLKQLLDEE